MATAGKIYKSKSNEIVLLTFSSSVGVEVIDFSLSLHKSISKFIESAPAASQIDYFNMCSGGFTELHDARR